MSSWVVVGISGVTSGGKSSLSKKLLEVLPPTTKLLCQDDYFHPIDSPHHIPVNGIPNHFNWDIITSLNMEKMNKDIKAITSQTITKDHLGANLNLRPVLLLEGFLLFDDPTVDNCCDAKYFLTLNYTQCLERRLQRCYDPPDVPGYFDLCVWPMYTEYRNRVVSSAGTVCFIDGSCNINNVFKQVYKDIEKLSRS